MKKLIFLLVLSITLISCTDIMTEIISDAEIEAQSDSLRITTTNSNNFGMLLVNAGDTIWYSYPPYPPDPLNPPADPGVIRDTIIVETNITNTVTNTIVDTVAPTIIINGGVHINNHSNNSNGNKKKP